MFRPFCSLLLALLLAGAAHAADNVLLIILDDYGVDSSPLYNASPAASFPPTPNITALAHSGVLFQNAYAQPVCSPTRACMLTGRYSFRTGVGEAFITGATPLSASEFTLPKAFAANPALGYQCAQFGKWHLSNGQSSPHVIGGWPLFKGPIQGALPDYFNWTKVTCGTGITTTSQTITNYTTTEIISDAIAWIAQRDAAGQPWVAWVALNPPHVPLHKPPNDLHSYDALPGTQAHINNNPRLYWEAMVEAADTEIGRLLASVNRAKTNVIFIGDNGTAANTIQPPFSSAKAKDTLYEGGIKVPMCISGPAVAGAPRTTSALVQAVDLFETILEMAGINVATTIPAGTAIDSRSLLPILKNETETTPRYAYADLFGTTITSAEGGQALRNGQFKLLRFQDRREEFYDLAIDPTETTPLNLAALDDTQFANYHSLVLRLAKYQDTLPSPVVTATTSNRVTVQRDAALSYTLWRSPNLGELSWAPVSNATIETTATTVTLTDPTPLPGQAFYVVLASQ
jgi:arylsulfatase A-like enzyme